MITAIKIQSHLFYREVDFINLQAITLPNDILFNEHYKFEAPQKDRRDYSNNLNQFNKMSFHCCD